MEGWKAYAAENEGNQCQVGSEHRVMQVNRFPGSLPRRGIFMRARKVFSLQSDALNSRLHEDEEASVSSRYTPIPDFIQPLPRNSLFANR